MSRSRITDSRNRRTVLEIVRRDDGAFDFYLNRQLNSSGIAADWLRRELCVRFGLCGKEFDPIADRIARDGRTELFI